MRLRLLREHELDHSVLHLTRRAEHRFERLRIDAVLPGDARAAEAFAGCRSMARVLDGVESLPHAGRESLGAARPGDVHEEDARVVEREVVVQGRDVQAVAERSVHRGAHLVLRQRQVAHHESLVAAALECGPGREPLERLHLDAVHRDPEVRARCGHLRHPVLPAATLDDVIEKESDDVVRRDETTVVIDDAKAISVTIAGDTDARRGFLHRPANRRHGAGPGHQ